MFRAKILKYLLFKYTLVANKIFQLHCYLSTIYIDMLLSNCVIFVRTDISYAFLVKIMYSVC